jgi:cysteinyl-tRNA synthetase
LSQAAKTCEEQFRAAMNDDFNTPAALAALFEWATEINRIISAGTKPGGGSGLDEARSTFRRLTEDVLGLTWPEPEDMVSDSLTPSLMELLISLRQSARENRDWKMADAIRDRLKELGVVLEDRVEGGTQWKVQA